MGGARRAMDRSRYTHSDSPAVWRFVNISRPVEIRDVACQRFVRSSVMRSHRRKQRLEAVKKLKRNDEAVKKLKRNDEAVAVQLYITSGNEDQLLSSDNNVEDLVPTTYPSSSLYRYPDKRVADYISAEIDLFADTLDYDADISHTNNKRDLYSSKRVMNSRPQPLLGRGIIDPLVSFPGTKDPQSQRLLLHFSTVLCHEYIPIDNGHGDNPLKMFTAQALTDPALYQGILYVAAAHTDGLYGHGIGENTLRYKGEAIRLVNLKLHKATEAVSDFTIGTVAMLAVIEVSLGNTKELNIHMEAIKTMVKIRGGLRALGMDAVLHMIIFCQDLLSSTLTRTMPRFTPSKCNATITPISSILNQSRLPSSEPDIYRPLYLPDSLELDVGPIFQDIRDLSLLLETFQYKNHITISEMMSFSKSRSSVEYRLLVLRAQSVPFPHLAYHHLYEASCIAAQVYINLILRELSIESPILTGLKLELMAQYIQHAETPHTHHTGDGESDNAHAWDGVELWLLCVAGVLALDKPEMSRWARYIAIVITKVGIGNFIQVEELLRKISWTERMTRLGSGELWREVQIWLEVLRGECDDCLMSW